MSENKEMKELNQEEMEQAAGGTFWFNNYSKSEYNNVGIEVVSHFIDKDEFWWKGENIGHENANAVVYFQQTTQQQPSSLKEALDYYNRSKPKSPGGPGGCDLVHLG